MSDLNELFAELKNEIAEQMPGIRGWQAEEMLYGLDRVINNGEFARAEQDAYIG